MDFLLNGIGRINRAPLWAKAMTVFAVLLAVAALLPHTPNTLVGGSLFGVAFAGSILDSYAEFCDATALNTGAAGTYLIGNVMDLTKARDVGSGRQVYVVINVDTAVTSGGAATVQFQIASDAQAAIATDGSATVHAQTAAIPKATLVAGYQLAIALPMESPAYEQFLGILQVTGTAALTAGKVNAFLTFDPPATARVYPNDPNIA